MRSALPLSRGGNPIQRAHRTTGFAYDEFKRDSAWIRETASVLLPAFAAPTVLVVRGEISAHPDARGIETELPGLIVHLNGSEVGRAPGHTGPWEIRVQAPGGQSIALHLTVTDVRYTNFLAWLGRVTGFGALQRFRRQHKNRQLRITTIATDANEPIADFSQRQAPLSAAFFRKHVQLGLNIAGFFTADLGVGESARCMARAADAAQLPCALVPLRLHCKNRLGDFTYQSRLQDSNPYPVNVVHVDPPASADLDHHHGAAFRAGKYNVAYFAWELPEFPDAWVPSIDYYDEIWCPSDFTREAIQMKSPVPVLKMPHAISFARPTESAAALRGRFGLPADKFIFLTLFDLNSYAERKNPRGAIAAFRAAGLGDEATLVIKVQNVEGNAADFARLRADVADLPGARLITETLPRAEIYALEAACDCFVSLHRAEGFGLAVAECMFLGKPVVSTDWSATAEFVNAHNGCPVPGSIVRLAETHGPYVKGQQWAEADIAAAAASMRRLFADRSLANALGAAGRKTIETQFSPAVIGARYRQRLESIFGF